MSETTYLGRRAHSIENGLIRLTVTVEGGHIASIQDLASGVNPLWTPPWPTIEPSSYRPHLHPEYGLNAESQLLSGILGHNLCLDLFGGPSEQEAAAGLSVHGEGSVVAFDTTSTATSITQTVLLPSCQLRFTRVIALGEGSRSASISETVENLSVCDRPCAWTQHVTLGPPFLEKGVTRFESTATRSRTMEFDFTGGMGHLAPAADFDWPAAPLIAGGVEDLRVYTSRPKSGAFTTHLMDPAQDRAWFLAFSPTHSLALAYIWRQSDFPWMGIWEENLGRTSPPWNGNAITRGMEFGVSPYPETRRSMITRGSLFGIPGYRWIPARSSVTANYLALLTPAASLDSALTASANTAPL